MAKYGTFLYSQYLYGIGIDVYEEDRDPNKIPQNLTLTNIDANTMSLTWTTPINTGGITSYNVYQAFTNDLSFNLIGSTTGLNYIASGFSQQKYFWPFYFAVTSVYSGTYNAVPYQPLNPQVSYVGSPNSLTIQWQPPILPVSGYQVWRTTDWKGSLTSIGTLTGTIFMDSGLDSTRAYYYRVSSLY